MTLPAGVRLGSYDVLELIGVGGMGEVYRARDAQLSRDVAVKILPSHVAADPDRLARFRREAQVLASLNHSNVGSIYGCEESDGVQALILELVDGPTLADRIAQRPIPLDEALPIAVQIAHALEAAHERGIVHRDLKPANIKVRPDDTVKVLDFGLAKALANDAAVPGSSATITSPALTQLGLILGTAAYMSPEQARGKEADKRSDIWAFGCVLYEMLTGKRAFEGSEISDTLASILKSDPDWTALPEQTSSGIRRVLRRCLEKDPRRRFHDIADVRIELEEPPVREISMISPTTSQWRERAAWAVAVASLMLLAAQSAYVRMKPAPAAEVSRFQIYPPPNSSFGGLGVSPHATDVAVSPDGTRLVFVAMDRAGKDMLWMQPFDSFDALPLAGTDGASYPFWEPHGGSIGFFVGSKLKKIPAAGGSPQTICDVGNESPRGGTWGSGGDIVFSSGGSPRLYRVDADGGVPLPLAMQGDSVTVQAMWPYFLPDGRTFLFFGIKAPEGPGVYAASMAPGATPKKLLTDRSNAAFDPSGFLLFTRGGALLRQRFDPIRLEVSGETRRVAERVAVDPPTALATFSVSNTGVLAFQSDDPGSQFAWFDRAGQLLERVGPPGRYRFPSMSPDGKRLVYMDFNDLNLWILDMGRQIPSKFTTGPAPCPVWSPDGRTILYWRPIGSTGVYQRSASAAGEETLLFKGHACLSQVSQDGKWLLYSAVPEGESAYDVYVVPMSGDKRPQRIVQSPFEDGEPQFSPDGRFVAYSSTWTGRSEVYVQPFPATGEQWQVSNQGGRQPLWRKNGKELFFINDDRKFFAVQIKPGPTFDYGTPQFLFDMRVNFVYARNSYIPSPDGQRFLVNMVLDTTSPPIHVVRNWTAGLKN